MQGTDEKSKTIVTDTIREKMLYSQDKNRIFKMEQLLLSWQMKQLNCYRRNKKSNK